MEENLGDIGLHNEFWVGHQSADKERSDRLVGLHQTENLSCIKGHYKESEKTTQCVRKYIQVKYLIRDLYPEFYKQALY